MFLISLSLKKVLNNLLIVAEIVKYLEKGSAFYAPAASGVEMAECTDNPGWNNMGCLECRRFECFSQIDIFHLISERRPLIRGIEKF